MTAWTEEENRLVLRGRNTLLTNREIAETINKAVYHGQSVRTRPCVEMYICSRQQPSFHQCRKMFEAGKSTRTIASETGRFESEIYNIMAWGRGTVLSVSRETSEVS